MNREYTNSKGHFGILFLDISGGYWWDDLKSIIETSIAPESMVENVASENISSINATVKIIKDDIEFLLKITEHNDISLVLSSDQTNENKQKLRDWATIIEEEVEKLKGE